MLKVNQPKQAQELKGEALAIKRLLLDESGTKLNPDAKALIRCLMRVSGMARHSDQIPSDKLQQYVGRKDIVVTILDTCFSDLQYYDNLIMLSTDDDNNNYGE